MTKVKNCLKFKSNWIKICILISAITKCIHEVQSLDFILKIELIIISLENSVGIDLLIGDSTFIGVIEICSIAFSNGKFSWSLALL